MNYWINIVSFKNLNFSQTYQLSQMLLKKNIETRRIWRPLNLQKYLKSLRHIILFMQKNLFEFSCVPSDDSLSISDIDEILII